MGRGNENLFATSGFHDLDGCHAHIWYKPFKRRLLQNEWANGPGALYATLGTQMFEKKMMTLC